MGQTWILNDDKTYRCTRCDTPSFDPGQGSCLCPPAGSSDAVDAQEPGSDRAGSFDLSDTGLPAGGLSYWERRLVELDRDADLCRKDLYRDRVAAKKLKHSSGETFLAERDSIRLRKECSVGISKVIADQRKGVQQGYEMAKARDHERLVLVQERTAKALALIRAGRQAEALVILEGAAN